MIYICIKTKQTKMKIYVLDLNICNEHFLKHFNARLLKSVDGKSYSMSDEINRRLYTEKGIIEIDKSGKMWNMEIVDDLELTKYLFDGQIRMYIDKSIAKRKEEVYQIVPNHISLITTKHIYARSSKSLIQFVVEEVDSNVSDAYFETNVDIGHSSVKDEIVTFLKHLNFIE
jgi:hypothetical protein